MEFNSEYDETRDGYEPYNFCHEYEKFPIRSHHKLSMNDNQLHTWAFRDMFPEDDQEVEAVTIPREFDPYVNEFEITFLSAKGEWSYTKNDIEFITIRNLGKYLIRLLLFFKAENNRPLNDWAYYIYIQHDGSEVEKVEIETHNSVPLPYIIKQFNLDIITPRSYEGKHFKSYDKYKAWDFYDNKKDELGFKLVDKKPTKSNERQILHHGFAPVLIDMTEFERSNLIPSEVITTDNWGNVEKSLEPNFKGKYPIGYLHEFHSLFVSNPEQRTFTVDDQYRTVNMKELAVRAMNGPPLFVSTLLTDEKDDPNVPQLINFQMDILNTIYSDSPQFYTYTIKDIAYMQIKGNVTYNEQDITDEWSIEFNIRFRTHISGVTRCILGPEELTFKFIFKEFNRLHRVYIGENAEIFLKWFYISFYTPRLTVMKEEEEN